MLSFVTGILAVIGLLALCALLYDWLVPDASEMPPDSLSLDAHPETEESARALAANLDAPLLEGSSIDLLRNGDEIFPAMLEAIHAARETVNLLTYIYWQGDIAQRFADALCAAAGRSVQVRLLVDAAGGHKMNKDVIARLHDAGCHFAWFRPLRWYNLGRYNHRTHRKVLVVDGRTGFTGGVGIAEVWTGDAGDPDHWRDNHFRVRGPAVRYLQGSFSVNWRQATGEVLIGQKLFPDLAETGSVRTVAIDAAPSSRISVIAFTYWLLFHGARRKIHITTPYFVPDPRLQLGLETAARRGVEVVLLVPGPHTDSPVVAAASKTWYRKLLEAGVAIHEYQPSMIHTKQVTVDDCWAIFGSPNFDARSFSLNYEEALVAFDESLSETLGASFADDLSHARQIRLEDIDAWPWWQHVRNRLARMVRAQL